MYSLNKNTVSIDDREYHFDYDIREVIPYKESLIVLLDIPEDILLATDFYGRRFRINPDTGKVLGSGDNNIRLW